MSWFKILRAPKPEKREAAPEKPRRKPRTKPLSADDHAVWSHVARSITPLEGRILPDEPPPAPEIAVREAAAPLLSAPAPAKPALPPLARIEKRMLRKVSRGSFEIDARIDLHGMRQAEAHAALHAFLYRQHHAGARLVLVITGKGARNPEPGEERGVLKRMVPHWLADPAMRRIIIGFENAAQGHGGEGALYVRLRRREA